MIDVKCHVRCGLSAITNPSGHEQVGDGRRRTTQEVTADLGAAWRDLEKQAATSVDDTCSIINVFLTCTNTMLTARCGSNDRKTHFLTE